MEGILDGRPVEAPKLSGNLARIVHDRSLRVPSLRTHTTELGRMRSFRESRLRVRARFEISPEGCTFALKFAPNSGQETSNEQYCMVTHGATMQVWEMSGVYTQRKSKQIHAAKLVMQLQHHTDVIASCEWMPSSFCETFTSIPPPTSSATSSEPIQVTMPPFFTAGFDKAIKYFKGGVCVGTMTEHEDWVRFMSVSTCGTRLVSGSVNSNIHGWDTTTLKPAWCILPGHEAPPHLYNSLEGINSINGLAWTKSSTTTFASGAGDGSVKLWDTRLIDSNANANSCVGSVLAHDGKLNNLQWFQDDRFLMTSGRDDVIRLLDMRMLRNSLQSSDSTPKRSSSPWNREKLVLQQYKGHLCGGYNIQASLYDNDTRICTGSRDGKIFIYDTWSGNIVNTLSGLVQPTHLVVPLPDRCGEGLISATAISSHLFVWAPTSTGENTDEEDLMPREGTDGETMVELARQEALENTIAQFGERFLKSIRRDGPASRTFFDDDVRAAYNQHMRNALRRQGGENILRHNPQEQSTVPPTAAPSNNPNNHGESSSSSPSSS
jgi:WD40 repeat protein